MPGNLISNTILTLNTTNSDKCFNLQTADSSRNTSLLWLNCLQSQYFNLQLFKRSCKKPPEKPTCPASKVVAVGSSVKTSQTYVLGFFFRSQSFQQRKFYSVLTFSRLEVQQM